MEDMAAYRCHSRRSSLSSLCFTPPPEAELTDINSTVSQTGSMIVSNVEYDQEPPTPAGFSFANDDGEVQHLDIAAVPERHYNHSAPSSGDNATQNCSSSAKNTFVPKLDLPPINLPSAQTACLSSYIGYSDSDEDEDELNLALVGTDQSAPSQQTSTTLQQSDEFPSSHTSSELQNPPGTSSTGSHRSKKVERSESISRSVLVVSRSTSAMDRKRPHSPATPVPVKRTKTPGPFAESDDDVDTPDPPSKLSLFARIRKGIQKNIKDKQAQMKAEATATVISKDTHAQVQEKASGQERRLQTPLAGFGSSERARPLGRTAANSAVVGKQVVSSKRGQAAPPQTEAAQTFVSKRSTFQDGQPPVPKPNNTGTFGHEIKKAGRSGSASTVTKSAAGSSSVAKNTVDQSAKAIIPSIFSADRVGVDKRLMKASRNGRLELEEQSMKTKAAALAAQDTVNRPTNAKPTTGNRNSHRPGDSKKVAVVSELSGPQTVVPKAANKPAVPTASKTRKTSQHGDPRRAERPVQMASTLPQTSQQSSNQKTEASMPPTRTKKAEPQAAEAKKATVVSIPKSQPVTQKPASKPAGTVLLPADRKVAIQVQKVTRPALPTKVNAVEDNRTGVTQKADAGIASKNNAVVTPKSNTSITLNANTVVAPKADAVVASTIAPQTTSRIPEPDHVSLA
ncbi:hypothetical protein K504DRAFT_7474 [Pleomassaria siparia CBS 279.74]|uniref:Uncharacterized protein n=1 Tax=Pleomassaria siparia CBS 279.74 TaxID=1314801 RepID=A0A6G1KP22_9PLEO|nr:hypothetical protein K504DRAFT_7474 [Pleomassaria siparia CBS 279.74]